jgi:hypothetical protein
VSSALRLPPRSGALVVLALALQACGGGVEDPAAAAASDWFAEVDAGLPGTDPDWPFGSFFTPELCQGGVGLLDANGDGDLELLHVRVAPSNAPRKAITNRLYENVGGPGEVRFVDRTEGSGLTVEAYGQGLAVGDTDNDGDVDLYVCNFGPDTFYRSSGDGTFQEATAASGFAESWWSTAAGFGDYDRDGLLDLYVVHYLRYDPGKSCTDLSDRPEYCGPVAFHGAPDTLYRNTGNGRFEDVTAAVGIVSPQEGSRAKGLGVIFADLTGDGLADVFVANDAQANQLWVARPDGTFTDEGVQRGVAFNRNGHTEADMGVAIGDVDLDGRFDLFVTHLWQENNRLWRNTGRFYQDSTVAVGLASHDLERTGFGCGFLDVDHDADLDLVVANGAIRRRPVLPGAGDGPWAPYREPNELFLNDGQGVFSLADAEAGPLVRRVEASRGLAQGDLDGDGDVDLVLSNIDNSLRCYVNTAPKGGNHWLRVRALTGKRDALGAEVVVTAGDLERRGLVLAAVSYCSSSDPRVHFGLGPHATFDAVTVHWPDGTVERFPGGDVDREVTVRQGSGEAR